jgi:hypothetical protein
MHPFVLVMTQHAFYGSSPKLGEKALHFAVDYAQILLDYLMSFLLAGLYR